MLAACSRTPPLVLALNRWNRASESTQQEDGGWLFDWLAWTPAQTTDWGGNVTIRALIWLHDDGRL